MPKTLPRLLAVLALGGLFAGCGKASRSQNLTGGSVLAPAAQGVGSIVTKNTARLGGADPATDAAAVARAVYPGLTAATRPQAVVLVNEENWPASLAAAALASTPLGAPLLYADGETLPEATAQALSAMHPVGASTLGGVQVIRIGTRALVPDADSTRTVAGGGDPATTAAEIEQLFETAEAATPRQVIVLASESPRALQMPAAGLAAESGAPILLVTTTTVPAATAAVLERLHRPTIFVVGASALAGRTLSALARLGRLVRVAAGTGHRVSSETGESGDPVANAISVARFADGSFGWNVHEAGHGLVFANVSRPLDGPAAAPLSAHGDFGPLLLLESSTLLPAALTHYLSDIEPGYTRAIKPVRGVYNHGWLIGDESAISAVAQAELDTLLEIAPRSEATVEASAPANE